MAHYSLVHTRCCLCHGFAPYVRDCVDVRAVLRRVYVRDVLRRVVDILRRVYVRDILRRVYVRDVLRRDVS